MILTIDEIDRKFEDFIDILNKKKKLKFDILKIRKAYLFAKKSHKNQKRDSGSPYIIHPLEVAILAYQNKLDSDSIVCALLHDVLEDCEVSESEIESKFGSQNLEIISGLTKIKKIGNENVNLDIKLFRKVLLASVKDVRILIIKLCDRVHNLRTINFVKDIEKRKNKCEITLNFMVPIAQKIGLFSLKNELENLCFKNLNPVIYESIIKRIGDDYEKRKKKLNYVLKEVNQTFKKTNYNLIKINGRIKNIYSIYKKMNQNGKSIGEINDLYAIRIIVKNLEDCYLILAHISKFFKIRRNVKDYITNPKKNEYQSIHIVIYSNIINELVEIQIRTEKMHLVAEFGLAVHWRYKKIEGDPFFEKKLNWIREIVDWEKYHKTDEEFNKLLNVDFFDKEIITFTPKSRIITLPEHAIVLDFAYFLHTDIANHTLSCEINGEKSPITSILKNGDIIKINTSKKKNVNQNWLKLVKSTKAKIGIRRALSLSKSNINIRKDDFIFDKITIFKNILGLDKYKKLKNAGCCLISKNEKIIGLLNKNKELIIHNKNCENVNKSTDKKIELIWKIPKNQIIEINIFLKEKLGIFTEILNIFSKYNISIININGNTTKKGVNYLKMKFNKDENFENLKNTLKNTSVVKEIQIIKQNIFNKLF